MNVIQIGCNNCDDEIYKLVEKNQELINKFIVVDALPKCIDIANKRYHFLKEKLTAINCAIGLKTEIIDFFFPTNDESSAHSSILKDHVINHRHESINKLSVQCFEINEFLKSQNIDEIDLLAIDIEGLDVDVLLNLNLEEYKINQIVYEFYHSDGTFSTGEKHNQLIKKFKENNYQLQQVSEYNILATKLN
jgi:FkbM family methyltransferase